MLWQYITSSWFCQEVFQKFFNLFRDFLSCCFPRFAHPSGGSSLRSRVRLSLTACCLAACFRSPLVDSLHIIALSFSFVNRFFEVFSVWIFKQIYAKASTIHAHIAQKKPSFFTFSPFRALNPGILSKKCAEKPKIPRPKARDFGYTRSGSELTERYII